MIPKQAIEKAVEGGYDSFPFLLMTRPYDKVYLDGDKIVAKKDKDGWNSTANAFLKDLNYYKIALDPTFWQALEKVINPHVYTHAIYLNMRGTPMARWQYLAQLFYDLILTEQPTEKFWQELLDTAPTE